MANSDTQLELVVRAVDQASAVLNNVKAQIEQFGDQATTSFDAAKNASDSSSAAIKTSLLATAAALTVVSAAAASMGNDVLTSFEQAQSTNAQLNSVLQSTGKSASITSDQVNDLASRLMEYSGVEDEAIKQGQTLLLQFDGITKDTLPEASKAMLDLAQRMGTDVVTAAKTVGMVLTEPDLAMRRLRSSGIILNQSQLDTVKALQDTGRSAQAAALVMQMLEDRVGGAAGAFRGTLAGSLAEVKAQFQEAQEQAGGMAEVFQPLIEGVSSFLASHQKLVAGLIAGAAAAGTFVAAAAAVIGIVALLSAVSLAVAGPLAIVAVLLGAVVFEAAEKLQDQFGDLTQTMTSGAAAIGGAADTGFGQASQAAEDLARKLQDIDDNVLKSNRDFDQSLADIVKTHQDKIAELTKQVQDEKDSFAKSQQDKTDSFNQSQQDMADQHQQSVNSIQEQLDDETAKGRFADLARVNDLKLRLQQENQDYQKSTAEKLSQYQTDTSNAQAESDKQLSDTQTQLDTETAFMQKHAADLQGIRAADALDEVQKLQQSHADQLAAFQQQRDDAIRTANQSVAGIAGAYNNLPSLIPQDLLHGVGTGLGNDMAAALKKSFVDALVNSSGWIVGNLTVLAHRASVGLEDFFTGKGGQAAKDMAAIPFVPFADGGVVTSPTFGVFGEAGPEAIIPLSNPQRAREVMQQAGLSGGGVTVNQTNHNYSMFDLSKAAAELGFAVRRA